MRILLLCVLILGVNGIVNDKYGSALTQKKRQLVDNDDSDYEHMAIGSTGNLGYANPETIHHNGGYSFSFFNFGHTGSKPFGQTTNHHYGNFEEPTFGHRNLGLSEDTSLSVSGSNVKSVIGNVHGDIKSGESSLSASQGEVNGKLLLQQLPVPQSVPVFVKGTVPLLLHTPYPLAYHHPFHIPVFHSAPVFKIPVILTRPIAHLQPHNHAPQSLLVYVPRQSSYVHPEEGVKSAAESSHIAEDSGIKRKLSIETKGEALGSETQSSYQKNDYRNNESQGRANYKLNSDIETVITSEGLNYSPIEHYLNTKLEGYSETGAENIDKGFGHSSQFNILNLGHQYKQNPESNINGYISEDRSRAVDAEHGFESTSGSQYESTSGKTSETETASEEDNISENDSGNTDINTGNVNYLKSESKSKEESSSSGSNSGESKPSDLKVQLGIIYKSLSDDIAAGHETRYNLRHSSDSDVNRNSRRNSGPNDATVNNPASDFAGKNSSLGNSTQSNSEQISQANEDQAGGDATDTVDDSEDITGSSLLTDGYNTDFNLEKHHLELQKTSGSSPEEVIDTHGKGYPLHTIARIGVHSDGNDLGSGINSEHHKTNNNPEPGFETVERSYEPSLGSLLVGNHLGYFLGLGSLSSAHGFHYSTSPDFGDFGSNIQHKIGSGYETVGNFGSQTSISDITVGDQGSNQNTNSSSSSKRYDSQHKAASDVINIRNGPRNNSDADKTTSGDAEAQNYDHLKNFNFNILTERLFYPAKPRKSSDEVAKNNTEVRRSTAPRAHGSVTWNSQQSSRQQSSTTPKYS